MQKTQSKTLSLKAKAAVTIIILILVSTAVVQGTLRIQDPTGSTNGYWEGEKYIRNSNGKTWTATGDNLQAAIWDLNSTGGTVWLPPGTIDTDTLYLETNVQLIGSGKYTTILNYTGSTSCIFIDTDGDHHIYSANIKDLKIDGNGHTAINLRAYNTMCITKCTFENLYLYDTVKGIFLNGTGQTYIYRNDFKDITINKFSEEGIYNYGGVYNVFESIGVEDGQAAGSRCIYNYGNGNRFDTIITEGVIRDDGQGNVWTKVHVETIKPLNTVMAQTAVFEIRGFNCVIDGLQLDDCNGSQCPYGLAVWGNYHTIYNLRATGSLYPNYLFSPNADSAGVMINCFGNSKFWGHLSNTNNVGNWTFIGGTDNFIKYNPRTQIPTSEYNYPNEGSMWFNTTSNELNVYNGTAWVSTTLT